MSNLKSYSLIFLISISLFANEKHEENHKEDHKDLHTKDHKEDNKKEHKVHKEDHKDEHGEDPHDNHDDHGDAKASDGFKLSEAGFKTFDIKLVSFSGSTTPIPKSAIYKGLNETNIYRRRNNLFKRIDFNTLSKSNGNYFVSSSDLKQGDQIVVNGIGFLRMAEIAATGGLESGHSH